MSNHFNMYPLLRHTFCKDFSSENKIYLFFSVITSIHFMLFYDLFIFAAAASAWRTKNPHRSQRSSLVGAVILLDFHTPPLNS